MATKSKHAKANDPNKGPPGGPLPENEDTGEKKHRNTAHDRG